MQVYAYCTLFDRVQIITPRNIRFIDDVPEDDESDGNYLASTREHFLFQQIKSTK